MRVQSIVWLICICFWAFKPVMAATPEQVVKKMVNAIKLKKFSKDLTEKDIKHNENMLRIASGSFDIEAMGKAALDKHWDAIAPEKREELIQKIRDLIIMLAYPGQSDVISGIQVIYKGQQIENDKARVNTLVIVKEKELKINYLLHQKENNWFIYDVLSSERSLVEDYRKQFDTIISKYSVEKLFELLDKKLKKR